MCTAVSDDGLWIVAGLTDGSLRAWRGRWCFWQERRSAAGGVIYDSTGSCDGCDADDRPCAAVHAHDARAIAVHALPDRDSHEFISVGRDGSWRHWMLDIKKPRFVEVAGGDLIHAQREKEGDTRNDLKGPTFCSSMLVPLQQGTARCRWSLVAGTNTGELYRIHFSDTGILQPSSVTVTQVADGCRITTIDWVPWTSGHVTDNQKECNDCEAESPGEAIVVGTSAGLVHVLT